VICRIGVDEVSRNGARVVNAIGVSAAVGSPTGAGGLERHKDARGASHETVTQKRRDGVGARNGAGVVDANRQSCGGVLCVDSSENATATSHKSVRDSGGVDVVSYDCAGVVNAARLSALVWRSACIRRRECGDDTSGSSLEAMIRQGIAGRIIAVGARDKSRIVDTGRPGAIQSVAAGPRGSE